MIHFGKLGGPFLNTSLEILFGFAQFSFRRLALREINDESNPPERRRFNQHRADQDRHARAILANVLFFVRRRIAGREQLLQLAVAESVIFRRRHFAPADAARAQVIARIPHDAQESIIRFENRRIVRRNDADDI